MKDYDKAVSLNSSDAVFFYKRSQLYTDLKRYDDAIKDIEECIKLGKNPEYFRAEASIYELNGDYKKADETIKKAIELSPDDISLKSKKYEINKKL